MTIERAIEILNPEHREHYESIEVVNEACLMGIEALRNQKKLALEIFGRLIEHKDTALWTIVTPPTICIDYKHFVDVAEQYGVCVKTEDENGN